MGRLTRCFEDVEKVRKEEERKPLYKKKGTIILENPEKHQKMKHIYSGICAKQNGKVIQMFQDFKSLGEIELKVKKILEKPLNKRELNGVEYFKISEL